MYQTATKGVLAATAIFICTAGWHPTPAHAGIELVENQVGSVRMPVVEKASAKKLHAARAAGNAAFGIVLQLTGVAPVETRDLIERTTVRSAPGTGVFRTIISGINIINPFSWMMNKAMTGNDIVEQTRQGIAGQITKYRRLVAGKATGAAAETVNFDVRLVRRKVVMDLPGGLFMSAYTDWSGKVSVPTDKIWQQLRLAGLHVPGNGEHLDIRLWALAYPEAGKVSISATRQGIDRIRN